DFLALEHLGRVLTVSGVQLGGERVAPEVVREGGAARLAQTRELGAALRDQAVVVGIRGRRSLRIGLFAHGSVTGPASSSLARTDRDRRRARLADGRSRTP